MSNARVILKIALDDPERAIRAVAYLYADAPDLMGEPQDGIALTINDQAPEDITAKVRERIDEIRTHDTYVYAHNMALKLHKHDKPDCWICAARARLAAQQAESRETNPIDGAPLWIGDRTDPADTSHDHFANVKHFADGECPCGVTKHHYHCVKCRRIVQTG